MINVGNSPRQIVDCYPGVASLLLRYDIAPSEEKSLAHAATEPHFLVELMSGAEGVSRLDASKYQQWSVPVLLEYLERSHAFYLSKLIPEVEQSIEAFMSGLEAKDGYLLSETFRLFVSDLKKHFVYEEQTLFPYARLLHGAESFPEKTPCIRTYLSFYSVKEFTDQHGEDEYQLEDFMYLVSLLSKRSAEPLYYRMAMQQLNRLSKDLRLHAFIEDEVLVQKLLQLEEVIL